MREDRCDLLCLDLEKAEALRRSRPSAAAAEIARSARALADPSRAIIAAALAQTDELCVCDLAWVTERPLQAVSYHLGVLRTAGLATSRRAGKVVFYALTDQGRRLADAHASGEGARA